MDIMDAKPRSPLTNSDRVKLVSQLIVKDLIEDWKKFYSIDITEESIAKYERVSLFRCLETKLLFYYPFDIAGSEEMYNSLSRLDWYYMAEKWEYDVAFDSLKNCSRLLEVGCGCGAFIERLAKSKSVEAVGIEQNKHAITLAQERNIPVIDLTLEQILENHKDHFDAVAAFQVLEHVVDPLKFLTDLITLLRLGGKLSISVPNSESFAQYADKHLLDQPPHHMHRWNQEAFASLTKILPLKLVKVSFEPLAIYHVDWFLDVQISRLSRNKLIRMIVSSVLKRIFAPALRKASFTRRLVKGHTLYVEFIKEPLTNS